MGSFADSVKQNSRKLLSKTNAKCYKIAKELFRLTVALSPSPENPGEHAKGLLANQWYPQNGSNFSNQLSSAINNGGAGSLARIASLSGDEFFGKDGSVTLANNLEYAYNAEALGWPAPRWSGVAPYRMVALSIQTIAMKYK